MCLSDLGQIVGHDPARHEAVVDLNGREMTVSTIALGLDLPVLRPGDWLVIHTGLAVERISDREADEIRRARQSLEGQPMKGHP
ncbi:MAG: HypC/HybG/HupF family hydrogenase formation chaperone [Actinomycetia bacterium]|nr:HypC/HybG/HupF family hydrogenase formation chaperone [Actinomycetes bacterium]